MDELASHFCGADLCWNYLLFMCALLFLKKLWAKERRLNLNFQQVLTLYFAILKDRDFRFPMLAGCLTRWGIVLLYQRFKCSS